jgi:hypothetical protein
MNNWFTKDTKVKQAAKEKGRKEGRKEGKKVCRRLHSAPCPRKRRARCEAASFI